VKDPGHVRSTPPVVTLLEDTMRWEANCADNEKQQTWAEKRRLWSTARTAARTRGEETPSEPESTGDNDVEEDEDKEEGGHNSLSPISPLP
jgi:hypothetical protein